MNFQVELQEWIESWKEDEPKYYTGLKEQVAAGESLDRIQAEDLLDYISVQDAGERLDCYEKYCGKGGYQISELEVIAAAETRDVHCDLCEDPDTSEFQLALDEDQAKKLGLYPNEVYGTHSIEVGLYGKWAEVWLCTPCFNGLKLLVG